MQNLSALVEGKKKRSLCLSSLAFVKPRRCRDRVFTVYSLVECAEQRRSMHLETKASQHEPSSASRCVTTGTIFRSYVHCGGNSREVAHSVQGVRILFEICVKAFSPVVSLSHL
ncbi:hypothetical protein YC2023_023874 [Brassica napus]